MTAVRNYFRTALLIDDRAVDTTDNLEPSGPIHADSEPAPGLVETTSTGAPLHWNKLVDAFLKEGVVCSVLKPERKDNIDNILDMAIRNSKSIDLLILDWDLFDDDGKATKRAIRKVIETDPRRLRVIVIYTEMSFDSVVDALIKECGLNRESDYVFVEESTIVLIFGKWSIKPMEERERSRIARYSDLPEKIRQDLETYFRGLVPELAFSSINIIRESAPRVLATFDSSLDAPLLTHRALLPEVSDVGPQFIRLLTSEFEAVLTESKPLTDLLSEEYIGNRLNDFKIISSAPETLVKELRESPNVADELKALDDMELTRKAVSTGLRRLGLGDAKLDKLLIPLIKTFSVDEGPHESLSAPDHQSSAPGRDRRVDEGPVDEGPHESLAALMSSTQFRDISPRLEAGVVLENKDEYWLCIQPLCDSVRLTKSRKFPLLPLVVNASKGGNVKIDSNAMICVADGKALPVQFCSHPYKLATPEFDPGEGGSSVQAKREEDAWYFVDTHGTRYQAICRLRSEFTQQAVQKLTSGVTRPGVDLSEWLRRSGRG